MSPDLTPTQRAILPLLTGRLDPDEQADLTPLTLADVERPGRRWALSPWECDRCGDLYDVQPDARGHMHDGDLLVCVSCGAVARVSADEDGAEAADPHGVLTEAAHADVFARARPAVGVLAEAADAARADQLSDARTLLRALVDPESARELAQAPPEHVEAHLLVCASARGLGGLVDTLRKAIRLATPRPEPDAERAPPRAGSVTRTLRAAGYPGSASLPDLPCPAGYVIDRTGVWREREDGDPACVCGAPVAVVGRSVDVATGDVRLVLAWPYAGAWRTEAVPRATALGGRSLLEAMGGRGAPVDGASAGAVCSWLLAQEQAAGSDLPTSRSLAHLGWSPDGGGFRLSTGSIGDALDLAPPGDGEAAAGYGMTSGASAGWICDVWTPLSAHPGALAVVAALAAPLLRVVGAVHGFTLELAAGSGRGKSTSLDAAASAWGPPSSVVRRWPTTKPGARESLTFRRSVPTLWDEAQDVRKSPDLISNALHLVGGEHGQTLGNAGGGTRAPKRIETILISTGEAPSADRCADAPGALARLVSMQGDPIQQGQRALVAGIQAGSRAHYGHAGPEVVRWLVAHRGEWEAIKDEYTRWVAHYARPGVDDQTARVGAHLALLRVSAMVMRRALGIVVPLAVLEAAGAAVTANAVERDIPLAALNHAHGWWIQRRHLAVEEVAHGVRIGWASSRVAGGPEHIAWLPAAMTDCLASGGYQPAAILRAWVERGWLRTQDGRTTHRVSRSTTGTTARCHVWSVEALTLLDDAPEPDTF